MEGPTEPIDDAADDELEIPELSAEERRRMVDMRVIRILEALPRRDLAEGAGAMIQHYLADEWACLEVAAHVVAPMFGVDATDPRACERIQRAAHEAIKAECLRMGGPPGER